MTNTTLVGLADEWAKHKDAASKNHCSDGGCIYGHPGGMHTNGGCRCGLERAGGYILQARYRSARGIADKMADAITALTQPSEGDAELVKAAGRVVWRHSLFAEALAEIKATVDGDSDQPVKAIIEGLLAEIDGTSLPTLPQPRKDRPSDAERGRLADWVAVQLRIVEDYIQDEVGEPWLTEIEDRALQYKHIISALRAPVAPQWVAVGDGLHLDDHGDYWLIGPCGETGAGEWNSRKRRFESSESGEEITGENMGWSPVWCLPITQPSKEGA